MRTSSFVRSLVRSIIVGRRGVLLFAGGCRVVQFRRQTRTPAPPPSSSSSSPSTLSAVVAVVFVCD